MPRVLRTVMPRIRRSLQERGFLPSLGRSVLLPVHLWQEYRRARTFTPTEPSHFDRTFGVNTDGDLQDWTYLSDLDIPSPNWIDGNDYSPVEPERLMGALSAAPLRHEDFVFVDLGSGKGRALLVASLFPFLRIIGVEFSPQLHAIARQNVAKFKDPSQRCVQVHCVCMDMASFPLPPEPTLLYLFHPCGERVLSRVLHNLESSLRENPRDIFICYVAPRLEHLMESAGFLKKIGASPESQVSWYRNISR